MKITVKYWIPEEGDTHSFTCDFCEPYQDEAEGFPVLKCGTIKDGKVNVLEIPFYDVLRIEAAARL